MNLDKLAVVLRSRKGGQSIDLGILLARRFYQPIILPWLLMAVPLLLLVQGGAYWLSGTIWLPLLVGWWLKPLFDRIPLFVISRGFFGSAPTTGETIRAVGRQWRSGEAWLDLTVRRLSPARLLTMPVRVLEGSRGAVLSQRMKSLYGGGAFSQAIGFLGLLMGIKALFYGAAAMLLMIATPGEIGDDFYIFAYLLDDAASLELMALLWLTTTVVTTLVEPFLSAGGFGIYIQRRIEREGWDLELKFRRMAARVEGAIGRAAGVILASFLSVAMLLGAAGELQAQERELAMMSSIPEEAAEAALSSVVHRELIPLEDPDAALAEIYEGPLFDRETERVLRWRRKAQDPEEPPSFETNSGLMRLLLLLADVGRVLIWVLFLGAVLYGLMRIYQYLQKRGGTATGEEKLSRWEEEILSQGGDPGKLPDDLVGAVRKAWAKGESRRALALLLLSSLKRFEKINRYQFLDGWTTARCAREVRHRGEEGRVLAAIALAFDEHAWGDREIASERFEGLIEEFIRVFPRPGGEDE